jgi:hypothetical protein
MYMHRKVLAPGMVPAKVEEKQAAVMGRYEATAQIALGKARM